MWTTVVSASDREVTTFCQENPYRPSGLALGLEVMEVFPEVAEPAFVVLARATVKRLARMWFWLCSTSGPRITTISHSSTVRMDSLLDFADANIVGNWLPSELMVTLRLERAITAGSSVATKVGQVDQFHP